MKSSLFRVVCKRLSLLRVNDIFRVESLGGLVYKRKKKCDVTIVYWVTV